MQLAVNRNPSPPPGGRPGGGYKVDGKQAYSEVVEGGVSSGGGAKPVMFVLLVIVLAVVGYAAYEMFVNDRNPVDAVTGWYAQITGDGAEETAKPEMTPEQRAKAKARAAKQAKLDAANAAALAAAEAARKAQVAPVAGNPYWALPNKIFGRLPLSRTWTSDEEETFRAGITHRFSYQRWQTVQTIRKLRLSGSDVVLWDAMQDRKFWTRMGAAVGLAELNIELSLNVIEGLLANARSELIADYFERYTRSPNSGQAFMLRQVVRILDEKGRLIALQGINKSQDGLRELYVAAATRDPGRHVQRWANKILSERPIPADRMQQLLAIVDGKLDPKAVLPGAVKPAPKPVAKKGDPKTTKPQGAPTDGGDGMTAEDSPDGADTEYEGTESDGDVEFYESDDAAPTETTDPESFEYSE